MGKIGKPRGVARYTSSGLFIEGYRSISLAANLLGISAYTISSACKDKSKEAGGYKWKYFAYSKPKAKPPKKPKITEAQRLANVERVLDKIAAARES